MVAICVVVVVAVVAVVILISLFSSNTVELSMLIAVEFGPVHCIKWHPSSSVKVGGIGSFSKLFILVNSAVVNLVAYHEYLPFITLCFWKL